MEIIRELFFAIALLIVGMLVLRFPHQCRSFVQKNFNGKHWLLNLSDREVFWNMRVSGIGALIMSAFIF